MVSNPTFPVKCWCFPMPHPLQPERVAFWPSFVDWKKKKKSFERWKQCKQSRLELENLTGAVGALPTPLAYSRCHLQRQQMKNKVPFVRVASGAKGLLKTCVSGERSQIRTGKGFIAVATEMVSGGRRSLGEGYWERVGGDHKEARGWR